mmetsp:Transcript_93261/g.263306  ORF Transcript_93261/g.263306 Transcript_93261/m.263306 type:complete len:200 (+) Transcript_93261:373-972(+)
MKEPSRRRRRRRGGRHRGYRTAWIGPTWPSGTWILLLQDPRPSCLPSATLPADLSASGALWKHPQQVFAPAPPPPQESRRRLGRPRPLKKPHSALAPKGRCFLPRRLPCANHFAVAATAGAPPARALTAWRFLVRPGSAVRVPKRDRRCCCQLRPPCRPGLRRAPKVCRSRPHMSALVETPSGMRRGSATLQTFVAGDP